MLGDQLRGLLLRYRAGRALYLLVKNLEDHHAPLAASAIAFDTFLSLVPLAAMAGYVLHTMHASGDVVLGPLIRAAPGPVGELVDAAFFRLSTSGALLVAPVSLAAFLWATSAGLSSAMSVFEAMFKSTPRPFWMRRLIAIGCVLGSLAVVALSTGLVLAGPPMSTIPGRIVAVCVPVFVVVGLLSAFFRIAIRGPRPLRRRVLPGAVVTVVLWAATTALFSVYVAKLARYATLYGSLAAVAIFLLWLWLLALAMLVGGEVNAQLEGVRDEPSELGARMGDGQPSSIKPIAAGPASKAAVVGATEGGRTGTGVGGGQSGEKAIG